VSDKQEVRIAIANTGKMEVMINKPSKKVRPEEFKTPISELAYPPFIGKICLKQALIPIYGG